MQCYHHKGRGAFDPVGAPGNKWTPSRYHYPRLKSDGGRFVAENVRLSDLCDSLNPPGARERYRYFMSGKLSRSRRGMTGALTLERVPSPLVVEAP